MRSNSSPLTSWITETGHDVRHAVRALIARPAYALGALLSLSLGIGANVVIYSVVSAVMIHAYRYPDADRLVEIYEVRQNSSHENVAPGSVGRLAQQATTLASIGAVSGWPVPSALTMSDGRAQMIGGQAVTPGLFSTLQITPLLGRLFQPEDAQTGRPHVVILRERMWREMFASDPHIIGRMISLDNTSYTVVGVIRDADAYPTWNQDIWVPYADRNTVNNFNTGNLTVVARLAPGVTLAQASAQVSAIARQISREHPNTWANAGLGVANMRDSELRDIRPFMLLLEATVALVLLIACANTANLALGRATGRERELAVRTALGAGRWRIARLLLTESIILALIGGALGVMLAVWSVPIIRDHLVAGYLTQGVAGWNEIAVNGNVVWFAVLISVAAGILFGVGPALHASRIDLTTSLKDGGRGASTGVGGTRLRTTLVTAQFVLALVLTVGAGLVARSFIALLHTDPGFQPQHVLTLDIGVPSGGKYLHDAAARPALAEIVSRVQALPGVRAAALASFIPLSHNYNGTTVAVAGTPPVADRDKPWVLEQAVTADYFHLLGIRLLRGQLWPRTTTGDTTRFVIVNEALVKKLLPGRDPIGVVLQMGWGSAPILGVVADTRAQAMEATEPEMHAYEPMEMQPQWRQFSLLVRVTGDPAAATGMIRSQIAAVDPSIAIGNVKAMESVVSDYLSPWLLLVVLIGGFAVVALIIAGIGIYSVVSYSVSQRTHELGIRMALGAQSDDVIHLVLRQALVPMLIALPIALLGAWAVARLLSFMLYGVGTIDVPTYLAMSLVLLGVATVACIVPARRAASVAPSVSLRHE